MPDITITVTAAQADRIGSAFGRAYTLHNPDGILRSATAAEVREFLIAYLKSIVIAEETKVQKEAIIVPDLNVT